MRLSSRHRIRNSSPGGLRPSTLLLGHGGSPQYWLSHVDGEVTFFVSFKPPRPGTKPRTLAWKAAVLTTTLGPPPYCLASPANFNYGRVLVTVLSHVTIMPVLLRPVNNFLGQVIENASEGKYNTGNSSSSGEVTFQKFLNSGIRSIFI